MPKYVGSQIQFSPREASVEVLKVYGKQMYIWDKVAKRMELWVHNQHCASSVIRYKGKNYEFVRGIR